MKTKLCIISLIVLGIALITGIVIKSNEVEPIVTTDVSLLTPNIELEVVDPIVYDGMTLNQLAIKLERNLNSTLTGYGYLYASYALEKGVDPYLALAITLHETGCKWNCSNLVKACNNVGGQKGTPSCNGGSYKAYATLEDGIKGYIDNLSNNYISKGLLTPEQIGPKYAASNTWAKNINAYIEKIKAN